MLTEVNMLKWLWDFLFHRHKWEWTVESKRDVYIVPYSGWNPGPGDLPNYTLVYYKGYCKECTKLIYRSERT